MLTPWVGWGRVVTTLSFEPRSAKRPRRTVTVDLTMTPIPDTTGHLPVPSIDDLSVLEVLALTLAHETGQLVHEGRPADLANTTGTKTSDTDPVTVMDTRAEEHLRRRLRAARPDDGLQGEEGSSIPSRSGLTWVVDPIDGTTNYLYDLPLYAVSVAVVVGDPTTPGAWRPVAGAVRAPALDITWSARAGGERGGADLRGRGMSPGPGASRRRSRRGWAARATSAPRSSAPASATSPNAEPNRPRCSPASCRPCATCAGWAVPPLTCASSAMADWTASSRSVSTRGTSQPGGWSSPRPEDLSPGSAVARLVWTWSSRPTRPCTLGCWRCWSHRLRAQVDPRSDRR